MFLKILLPALLLLPAMGLASGDPPVDDSSAGADGPHVFYRGRKIVVKTLEEQDNNIVLRTETFSDPKEVTLTCKVPETGDVFSFRLQEDIPIPETRHSLPARMLVLSDIEGNFEAFKKMLIGGKVLDKDLNWIYKDGHLVLVGDFFDRGLNVTECLWLVYKIEQEARLAGGEVHFIMGNHELLNLEGNTRYVRRKYLLNEVLMGEKYTSLFSSRTELGRWLRTKNAVEIIGDYVFCHGGISPELARLDLPLEEINRIGRSHYGTRHEMLVDPVTKLVFDAELGIFWYRQAARNRLSEAEVDFVLKYAGAKHMVIGHTMVPDVTALYGGRVICVDLYHDENLRQGFVKTLLVEKGLPVGLDSNGEKTSVFSVAYRSKQ